MKKLLLFSFLLISAACMGQTVAFQIVTPAASGAVSDANSTVLESAATATINVIRTGTAVGQTTVDVNLASAPLSGTAVAGTDFTFTGPQTITFPASTGNSTQSFTVTINNNTTGQPTRYAVFQLSNATGGATINSSTNSNTHILYIKDDDQPVTTPSKSIEFQFTSSYQVGTVGTSSAEIIAHDPVSQRLFVVNSIANKLEILNFSNPASIAPIQSIDISAYGAGINSVAVKNGIVAVAVEGTNVAAATSSVSGKVVFFDTSGTLISQVSVGVQPDMVGFSPDGKTVMTANEGEPSANYSFDPEGSISIIDLSNGAVGLQQSSVTTLNFNSFDSQIATLRTQGIRIYGNNGAGINATVSQDFEPEYVTFSNDSRKAWVVLQENNAMVTVDVVTKQISSIFPLGYKDHSVALNAFDASDRVSNNQIIPVNWPVKGMYQPDGISYFEIGGTPYVIGATEGDSRNWVVSNVGYNEENRMADAAIVLNPTNFPNASILKRNSALGRLTITNANKNTTTNQFDEIQVLGGRSFAIWNANTGALVFDSGNAIEKITSEDATWGSLFNADHSNNNVKDRSDNKGPEPEGVVTTVIAGKTYAFIGLERVGGIMVFDITNPTAPIFSDYLNSRTIPPAAIGGDRGAEGIIYIAAQDSPTGNAMVLAGNEVSSTVSVYSLKNIAVTAAPVATAATSIALTGFTANWNAVAGATGYLLDVSTNNFATFVTGNNARSTTGTTATVTGLTANTAYSYRVRATNANGNSANSNVVSATTLAITRIVGTTGTLAFGDVIVGETPNQKSFTITNSGNSDLSITGISVPTGYTVTPTTGTVIPAGILNVQVTFNPTAPQDYNGNATITSNSTSGTSTIAITGRGVKITAAEDLVTEGLTVYPNPVKGVFTIKCKDAIDSEKQVRLMDETGKEFEFVSLQVLDKNTLQVDISSLPNGLYILKMEANKKSLSKKIVKAQN